MPMSGETKNNDLGETSRNSENFKTDLFIMSEDNSEKLVNCHPGRVIDLSVVPISMKAGSGQ